MPNLTQADGELTVAIARPVTLGAVLDALEARRPVLQGSARDAATGRRRPFIRFFACRQDFSHVPPDAILPEAVAAGREPLLIVGAMAGGLRPGCDGAVTNAAGHCAGPAV